MAYPDPPIANQEIVQGGIQSNNYVEGQAGWAINSNGQAQFDSVSVLNTLGAVTLSGDTILVNGADLVNDILSPIPLGMIAFDSGGQNVDTATIGTTETIIFQFAAGQVYNVRRYHIFFMTHLVANDVATAVDVNMRYTTDGTLPTVASASLRLDRWSVGDVTASGAFTMDAYFSPTTDVTNFNLCITIHTDTSPDTVHVSYSVSRVTQMGVVDLGLDSVAYTPGALSQVSVASGSPGPSPKTTYQPFYNAQWTRSFNGDGSIWTNFGAETSHLYQGKYSNTHGNTKSMVGFDYAKIQSDLSGATINWIKLTYKVMHTYYNAGVHVVFGTHNASSKPSSFSQVSSDIVDWPNNAAGSTITHTMPLSLATALQAGTVKGITLGPGLDNSLSYYGYFYGFSDGNAPKLQINYTK